MLAIPKFRFPWSAAARAALLVSCLVCGACSTLSLDGARSLAAGGRDAAVKIKAAGFASDAEYARALDAEVFLHGANQSLDSPQYKQLLEQYADIDRELALRADVVAALADFYDAFGDLAAYDASGATQDALAKLGGAVDGYRKEVLGEGPLSAGAVDLVVHVGGLLAAEAQKDAIKRASVAVRPRLVAFHDALADPRVRRQLTGFKLLLAADRTAAVRRLWELGALDPLPVLTGMGADAGLSPVKDAADVVRKSDELKRGVDAVIARRGADQLAAIEHSYDASVALVADLVAEHQKLEAGAPLDIARVRALVAELTTLIDLIAKR